MSTPDYDKMSIAELEKQLNERQRKFVHELMIDGNQTQAAIRAGYKERAAYSQASDLLKNPKVAAYRRAYAREQFKALGYDKPQLALKLCEIIDRCMDKKPVLEWNSATHKWEASGRWQFNPNGAIRAIEAVAKLMGLNEAQVVSIQGEGMEQFLEKIGGGGRFA